MQAKQQPSEQPEFNRLDSVEELATERFGSAEGLAIVQKNTLDLSKFYAERYGLDATDPEVTLTATALAFARHKEFTLLRELEHDLFERVTTSTAAVTYGQVLFNTTRTGAYRDVYRELDRLHNRAAVYLKELRELAKEQTYLEDEC
tara:strand:- start:486 stop:926 length:441 start_codon:yes stop_codon:yes gene_type:complete